MNRIIIFLAFFFAISLTSCDLISDLVPDIDTDFSKTYQVKIYSNKGETANLLLDVTTSDEYNDFKNNIEGFELRRITYEIKNYNAPEDLYFTGDVICSNEEETESYIVGRINKTKISDLADTGNENDLTEVMENIETVLSWLENPGKLNVKTGYILTDVDDNPYKINGLNSGSNFELVINFYLTVKTQV